MSELGDRIKMLRKEKHLTQSKLTDILRNDYDLKTDRVMISKWETGFQTPHTDTLKIIAKVLGVSVDYLLTGMDAITPDLTEDSPIPVKKIRMLGSIACGTPIFCNEEYEYVIATGENAKADFCLTARGDSMINARIADGDIVFIKQQSTVENGEIAAVVIGDEATLKRVYRTADGIMLMPENPAYQPMYFSGDELSQAYVLGKAIGFQSMNLT
ncbi:MAG: helix-turn-helix domain-containing protein [Clostridia bacterium]|nr:helix-turn-helix domain-containing protein [Clostridia bacterium]